MSPKKKIELKEREKEHQNKGTFQRVKEIVFLKEFLSEAR
jgi:hypothetical protein